MLDAWSKETILRFQKPCGLSTLGTIQDALNLYCDLFLETPGNDINWTMLYPLCARIVVLVVVLVLKVCGISLDISSMEDTIRKTEEAMRGSSKFENGVQVFLESWRDAEDSNMEKAEAIFDLLRVTHGAGFLWMIIKSLCTDMAMWRWIKTAAVVSAMIIAAFASGGVALIALIAVAVGAAIELTADIKEALKHL